MLIVVQIRNIHIPPSPAPPDARRSRSHVTIPRTPIPQTDHQPCGHIAESFDDRVGGEDLYHGPFASWSLDGTRTLTVAARNTAALSSGQHPRTSTNPSGPASVSRGGAGELKHRIQLWSPMSEVPDVTRVQSRKPVVGGLRSSAVGGPDGHRLVRYRDAIARPIGSWASPFRTSQDFQNNATATATASGCTGWQLAPGGGSLTRTPPVVYDSHQVSPERKLPSGASILWCRPSSNILLRKKPAAQTLSWIRPGPRIESGPSQPPKAENTTHNTL
jgi:hypothetical protein